MWNICTLWANFRLILQYALHRFGVMVILLKKTVEVLYLEGETYQSAGIFSGEQKLPSLVVPDFPVRVAQIFA